MSYNSNLSSRLLDSEASISPATGYNPLLFPPDVEKARIHGRASRAKKYNGDSEDPKGEICECCERPVEAKPLGFRCTIQDLYQYRYCAPLFFQFAQYCLKILAVLLVSFGAYCMFMNSRGSYVGDHSSAFGNRFSVLQILNHNEEWDSLYVQTFMMAVGAILLLIMRHRLRKAQKQVIWECKKEINSPSEYALRLIGLKGVEITEEEVKEYIINNTEVKDPDAIKKVMFVYDIHELTDLHRQRLKLMNSAAVPVAVNFLTHYLKDDAKTSVLDGLAYDMYFIFLTNAITTPLLLFFDPTFTARAYHQSNLENDPKYNCMTQAEANELFEYPPFDASAKYSAYIKTLWMTALFAPLIPVVIVISLMGLTVRYWLDKFLLIRRNSAPKMMGKKLSMRMLKYLELTPFWFGLGSLLINVYSREVYHELSFGIVICLLVMLVSLIHLFIPTNKISKKLRRGHNRKSVTVSYSEAQLAFSTDYDRSYPLTQAKAEETRLEEFIKTVSDQKIISQLQTMLENLRVLRQNRKPLDSSLANYVVQNADLQDAYRGNIYGCHAGRREDHFYQANAAPVFEINVPVQEERHGQNQSMLMPQSRVQFAAASSKQERKKEKKREKEKENQGSSSNFPNPNAFPGGAGAKYPTFENQGFVVTSQQPQGYINPGYNQNGYVL